MLLVPAEFAGEPRILRIKQELGNLDVSCLDRHMACRHCKLPPCPSPIQLGARRKNMQAIRSRGNRSTEWRLRAVLVQRAIRGWNLHPRNVIGGPDFFFQVEKLAVFVDGCFWHGCPRCGHIPKTSVSYWQKKIAGNRDRDQHITRSLKRAGCKVIRIWECEMRSDPRRCAERIMAVLHCRI